MFFYKTLYYWYFEFIAKQHKTRDDFKDLRSYFAELIIISSLMGLGVSKLIDMFCGYMDSKKKLESLKQQNQPEATESQAE
jgi:hypothetical protein